MKFTIQSPFAPQGDQPEAIEKLVDGLSAGLKNQTLLGVTGSGKTFTMANIIAKTQMPALILCHNKTLAGQLYQEMRDFFPHNSVSYFVSYYDYYQPEAYVPSSDTYIEKTAQINETIDKLRLQSTANILTKDDVIVVASVSSIYNIGNPEDFEKFIINFNIGDILDTKLFTLQLAALQYTRNEYDFKRGTFRIRGSAIDIHPASQDLAMRIVLGVKNGVTEVYNFDPLTGKKVGETPTGPFYIYPAKQYLTDRPTFEKVEKYIRKDLQVESDELKAQGKLLEAQRLVQRVTYDLEMIKEIGYVSGIENYGRYFDGREIGAKPYGLVDYFNKSYGDNWITFVDESHMTLSQIAGMYNGDFARKKTLIDFGFRLKSAFDNRPMKFDEFYAAVKKFIFVSATPSDKEQEWSKDEARIKHYMGHEGIVEQLVRPTGIVDPMAQIRPAKNEIEDLVAEIEKRVKTSEKILVTTLTKKTAEDLTDFLKQKGVRAEYLHSDIETLERSNVLDNLRRGTFDVLIGINLLREGLDLPEVTLVAILDADKEGFLRSRTSLIQTMGRAARNTMGEVIMYADVITGSIQAALDEIDRRRTYQLAFNKEHNISPYNITKAIKEKIITNAEEELGLVAKAGKKEYARKDLEDITINALTPFDKKKLIKKLEAEMKRYASEMNFEMAIMLRDKIRQLRG
jgi:excinuclease ABC subunit B